MSTLNIDALKVFEEWRWQFFVSHHGYLSCKIIFQDGLFMTNMEKVREQFSSKEIFIYAEKNKALEATDIL